MSVAARDPAVPIASPSGAFALLWTTVRLLAQRPLPFLGATAIVVVPILLLVDVAGGGQLADGRDAEPSTAAAVVSLPLLVVVLPALVTTLHCLLVRDLAAGRPARLGTALHATWPHAASAFGAVALYLLGVLAALILIVPGVWLAVRLYFGAQAAVLDDLRALEALERSAALVKGRWWSTAGRLLLSVAATFAIGVPAGRVIDVLDATPVIAVALALVLQCILLSFSALYATLLFLTLRACQR